MCVENRRDLRNRLVAPRLLNIVSVIQTGISHNIIRFACFSFASRAEVPCKLGSVTGQPLHRLARSVLAIL